MNECMNTVAMLYNSNDNMFQFTITDEGVVETSGCYLCIPTYTPGAEGLVAIYDKHCEMRKANIMLPAIILPLNGQIG